MRLMGRLAIVRRGMVWKAHHSEAEFRELVGGIFWIDFVFACQQVTYCSSDDTEIGRKNQVTVYVGEGALGDTVKKVVSQNHSKNLVDGAVCAHLTNL